MATSPESLGESNESAQVDPHQESAPPKPATKVKTEFLQTRLVSLDAYRGLIMITLAFSGFGLARTAENILKDNPDSLIWRAIGYEFSHVQWTGCTYWDLIQPSFMFMVGAAMAFSYAKRRQLGQSWPQMFAHALARSVILVFLGIFLTSNGGKGTNWSLMNVLSQIGLGYTFLFLIWGLSFRLQAVVAAGILVGTWLLYVAFPGADVFQGATAVGVEPEWAARYLDGIGAAWHKNANAGHAIDIWLLNLPRNDIFKNIVWVFQILPAPPQFAFNRGGYQTLNFVPSLATMLFGLMCGELLRSNRTAASKIWILILSGTAGILLGYALQVTGICPLVKRIWTPSWALFSTGWCVLILTLLYGIIDVMGWRWWTFPLTVVGVNSIAIYCMGQLLKPWTREMYKTHLGASIFQQFGPCAPLVQYTIIGAFFWIICWWMYRQKIFVRI